VERRLDVPFQLRLGVPERAQRGNGTELTRPKIETRTRENLAERELNRKPDEIGRNVRGGENRRRDVRSAKLLDGRHACGVAISWVHWVH
jgi:hypothetical protein